MSANDIEESAALGATVVVADDSKAFCTRLSRLVARIPGIGTVVEACFDKTTELDAIAPFIAARLPEAGGSRAPECGHGLGNNQTPGKDEERA